MIEQGQDCKSTITWKTSDFPGFLPRKQLLLGEGPAFPFFQISSEFACASARKSYWYKLSVLNCKPYNCILSSASNRHAPVGSPLEPSKAAVEKSGLAVRWGLTAAYGRMNRRPRLGGRPAEELDRGQAGPQAAGPSVPPSRPARKRQRSWSGFILYGLRMEDHEKGAPICRLC